MNSQSDPSLTVPEESASKLSVTTGWRSLPYRMGISNPWAWASFLIMLLVLVPLVFVGVALFQGDPHGDWAHIVSYKLREVIINSLLLCLGVASIAAVIGVTCAWLVTMCQFPGRRIFEWALLLPLAVPAYIMAYTYTDLLDYAGPVQSSLRTLFSWKHHSDYWFPEIRSLGGAILMMGLVLYPYVYLTCRTAFLDQSVCVLEAGRTLGHSPFACFRRIALPLARPALIAGLSLVMMETLADYGTVDYFAVPSFTVEIYRAWTNFGSYALACKLAAVLMIVVGVVLTLERISRGRRRYHHTTGRVRNLPRWQLSGWRSWMTIVICSLPLLLGFLVPVLLLLRRALRHGDTRWAETLSELALNSFTVSAIAALGVLVLALIVVYSARLMPSFITLTARRVGGLGYAVPGSVIAVAIVMPFGWLDNRIDGIMHSWFDIRTGLILSGSIAAVIFAYIVRFLAIGLGTLDAGLGRIPQSLDSAGRTLGAGPCRVLTTVHVPLMRGAVFTSMLLVFVDAMKELPATMILRPFNFDTLAVRVHALAHDERLGEAAFPALVILAVGLLPVLLLSRLITKSRKTEGLS